MHRCAEKGVTVGMPRKGSTNVALPTDLVDEIRHAGSDRSNHYISMADLVREAIREKQ